MTEKDRHAAAQQNMDRFADRTGLTSDKPARRYLWTDAFAVCIWLELFRRAGDKEHLNLALSLVDQVHHVLAKHREDDPRTGWISGLGEDQGESHPTRGGLRIGKQLNERKPEEPFDPNLEWERDGQYFHYLTKWMHALNRVARIKQDRTYRRWAAELARTAHNAFTYELPSTGEKHMYWKMSIDLSYPLVPSMGQHDPLDALITYWELNTAYGGLEQVDAIDLKSEIAEAAGMCVHRDWTTTDALGIGGLLTDAYWTAQLLTVGAGIQVDLLTELLEAIRQSMGVYISHSELKGPASYRLAFRELGLALGLQALEPLQRLLSQNTSTFGDLDSIDALLNDLMRYKPIGGEIVRFWRTERAQAADTWTSHEDINAVMLAACLIPEGYLRV